MKLTNTPATLFNAWKDPETKRTLYLPTVLRDVKWQGTRASKIDTLGLSTSDAVTTLTTIIIWPSRLDAGGKQFVAPKAYKRMSGDEVRGYWTLSDELDRFAKGIVGDMDSEAAIETITSKYDNVVRIAAVAINDFGPVSMRHFYVTGSGA